MATFRLLRGSALRGLLALGLWPAAAEPCAAERLLVTQYTEADGLAYDVVNGIVPDSTGFLWHCTSNGLSRFDGEEFVNYGTGDDLPHTTINHLLEARDSTLWVATNGGGIARLESAATGGPLFTTVSVGPTGPSNRVNRLHETSRGDLLAGTDGGLWRADAGRQAPHFERLELGFADESDASLQVWTFHETADGVLWVGTSAGLARLAPGGGGDHLPVAPIQGADHVWEIAVDAAGRLWLAHERGLVVWWPEDSTRAGERGLPLAADAIPCEDRTNTGSELQLPETPGASCQWAPSAAMEVSESKVARDYVRDIVQEPGGTTWLTSHHGLIHFDGRRFRLLGEANGLPDRRLAAATLGPEGDLWLASPRGVLRVQLDGTLSYGPAGEEHPCIQTGRATAG